MAFTIDRIFFSENDKGGSGAGQVIDEANLERVLFTGRLNYIISGLGVTEGSAGVASVAAGVAKIQGRYVDLSGSDTLDINGGATPNGSDWYTLWLKLTRDGDSNVDNVSLVKRNDDTIETDSVLLAELRVGSGGSISDIFARGAGGPHVATGVYNTALASPHAGDKVRIGARPKRVTAWDSGETNVVTEFDGGPSIAHAGSGTITIADYGFSVGGNLDAVNAEYYAEY